MKKLLLATLLLGVGIASAQEGSATDPAPIPAAPGVPEGVPPPGDPVARPLTEENAEKARLAHEAAGEPGEHTQPEVEEHVDPSQHFNFTNFDFRGKDEFGGVFGDGKMVDPHTGHVLKYEEPMSAPFVLMLLNFAVLMFLLIKFGWPVFGKLARDRHDQIKTALDDAAKLRDAAQKKLTEYEARIKGVDDEIKKLVEGIRADADADKARILKAAEAQAAQLQRDAESRIAAEIELARAQLTKEVTAAAAAAAEKLLAEKVTADDQARLVSTFISNVQSQTKEAR